MASAPGPQEVAGIARQFRSTNARHSLAVNGPGGTRGGLPAKVLHRGGLRTVRSPLTHAARGRPAWPRRARVPGSRARHPDSGARFRFGRGSGSRRRCRILRRCPRISPGTPRNALLLHRSRRGRGIRCRDRSGRSRFRRHRQLFVGCPSTASSVLPRRRSPFDPCRGCRGSVGRRRPR